MSNNHCYTCSKAISGKKSIECCKCQEAFCKDHIKVSDSDFSSICFPCFTKKIRLEVSLEMENDLLDAKSQLASFKDRLKTSKKDLSSKKGTIERLEGQLKINEKTYSRKFENLEKKIEDEGKRNTNILATIDSLQVALDDGKNIEKITEKKIESLETEFVEEQSQLESVIQENNMKKSELHELDKKMKNCIPYTRLRNGICQSCKNKVKLAFKNEIISGNEGKQSLIASVLAERERASMRKSDSPDKKEEKEGKKADDSCKCVIS